MTTFFGVINTSSPHIYHSALPLSPKTSIVWKLYKPHSHPLTRVVYGLPTSWEQSVTSVGFTSSIKTAVWSPCSKFIAVAWGRFEYGGTIEILDAGTLGQLSILPLYKQSITRCLIFSPDTSLLTWIGQNPDWIISWDVQTGVQVSAISIELLKNPWGHVSATFSTCGTVIGVHSCNTNTSTISTYNVLSGTHTYSHSVKRLELWEVWTHGECLRYAVLKSKSRTINIWGVGFTTTDTLAKVESLSLPDNFPSKGIPHFYPVLSRVAFSVNGRYYIWDTKHSKSLLSSKDITSFRGAPFSSDGHFLACEIDDSKVEIWKESSTGYIHHQRLTPVTGSRLHVSLNGGLLLTWSTSVAQLWHITDSSVSNQTTSTQVSQRDISYHHLVFSPDKALAAVTQLRGRAVTVLDLKSGLPRLSIDTGMTVQGLGVARSTIVVVGHKHTGGKVVTWNIPARGHALNLMANDRVKTIAVETSSSYLPISVSPDLHYIALANPGPQEHTTAVQLVDVLTGQYLTSGHGNVSEPAQFTQDGCEVWCIGSSEEGWKIIKDSESNSTKLEPLGSTKCPPGEFPWQCPPGYKVTDGWIFHSSGKRLLWLPPHWWPDQYERVWAGQFLALLGRELPEVLILELE